MSEYYENPPATEQGRSTTSWHARSIRFPRPYHHLTSNFKLYPISHLKPTGTYTDQLTLPFRIYCPNFSLYMSFQTEHCWRKLCPTKAGEYKNNAVISLFYFYFLLANRGGIWGPTSGDIEARTTPERLKRLKYFKSKYYTPTVSIRESDLSDWYWRIDNKGCQLTQF